MRYIHSFVAAMAIVAGSAAAVDISVVKASADSTVHTNVTGVVTSVGGSTNRRQFTIQDATGGLLIDNKGSLTYTQPNVGDTVTILEGAKTTFSGTIQFQPTTNADVSVTPGPVALPAPVVFNSIDDLLNYNSTDIQGLRVQLNGVVFTNAPASFWGSAGGRNFTVREVAAATPTATVRLTSDIGGTATIWADKISPANYVDSVNTGDLVNVLGVGAIFGGVNQLYINNPPGTIAKFDVNGPIIDGSSNVSDWSMY